MYNGTALLSDGTTAYMDQCNENLGGGGIIATATADPHSCNGVIYANGQCPVSGAGTGATHGTTGTGAGNSENVAPTKDPEVQQQAISGQNSWGQCVAAHTVDYCRANNP